MNYQTTQDLLQKPISRVALSHIHINQTLISLQRSIHRPGYSHASYRLIPTHSQPLAVQKDIRVYPKSLYSILTFMGCNEKNVVNKSNPGCLPGWTTTFNTKDLTYGCANNRRTCRYNSRTSLRIISALINHANVI